MKRQHTEWRKIFASDTSDKGLISDIYKEMIQLTQTKVAQLVRCGNTKLKVVSSVPSKVHAWVGGSVPSWGVFERQLVYDSLAH